MQLSIHITGMHYITWAHNMEIMLKKAHQRFYPLWYLRTCGISTHWIVNFYRGTIENILMGGITVQHGSTTAQNRKAIQRVVKMTEKVIIH